MRGRDLKVVVRLIADFMYAYGFLLLVPVAIGLLMGEYAQALCFGLGAALFIPVCAVLRRRMVAADAEKRHAAVALALTWTLLSLFSSAPFVVHGIAWGDQHPQTGRCRPSEPQPRAVRLGRNPGSRFSRVGRLSPWKPAGRAVTHHWCRYGPGDVAQL